MRTKELNAGKAVLPKLSEDDLQANCITWFRTQYKHLYWRLYSIPNSGKRHIITAANMKRTGQVSGVWDLFLSLPRYRLRKKFYCGLYIEIKVGKNKLTDNQIAFEKANNWDYQFKVCYTLDEFIREVTDYLK